MNDQDFKELQETLRDLFRDAAPKITERQQLELVKLICETKLLPQHLSFPPIDQPKKLLPLEIVYREGDKL